MDTNDSNTNFKNYIAFNKFCSHLHDNIEDKISSFGYQDIYIKMDRYMKLYEEPKSFSMHLTGMALYFWYNKYGYEFYLNIDNSENIIISSEEARNTLYDIIDFIRNPINFNNTDIEKEFLEYIKNLNFYDIKQFYSLGADKDNIQVDAYKNNIKYKLRLTRRWYNEPVEIDDDEPIEFSNEEIDKYREETNKIITRDLVDMPYEVKFNLSLTEAFITVQENLKIHNLKISQYNSDITWSEDIYFNTVSIWCSSKFNIQYFIQLLKENRYHVIYNLNKPNIIETYFEGIKYTIEMYSMKSIDFDNMEGKEFEYFCANVLKYNGYENVQVTQASNDQGIDIIAYKDDIKYGIQCKCYSSDVGNKAVQEVYAGKSYYDCDVGVVLINRYFTPSAISLAKSNRVHLWDRKKLEQLINNCKDELMQV